MPGATPALCSALLAVLLISWAEPHAAASALGARSGVPQAYKEVLGLTFRFYEAQRLGKLPAGNRIPCRRDGFLQDSVQGGWADAGDTIKHSLTTDRTHAGQLATAKASVRWGADYLQACHVAQYQFVGLIGDPDVDHNYWYRPEDFTGARRTYTWDRAHAASDLLGQTSTALTAASLLFSADNATYAASLLATARHLYQWGVEVQGIYSVSYPGYPSDLYKSNRYRDKLMLAAAWLYRATGNATYLTAARTHYQGEGGRGKSGEAGGGGGGAAALSPSSPLHLSSSCCLHASLPVALLCLACQFPTSFSHGCPPHVSSTPYVTYDSSHVPAAALLLDIARQAGTAAVPGHAEYADFYATTFMRSHMDADGTWGITRTPLGMSRPDWSSWGNLGYSTSVAFMALLRARQLPAGDATRAAYIAYAKGQIDYALAATRRSYVVGWGIRPPLRPHHRCASCPNLPAPCGEYQYDTVDPNPQVVYGALVGGPRGPGDNTYYDVRSDYVTNEVSLVYNAGFTGALAALVQLLS
ncbi:endo-beta-1,4-glucanase 1 [Micractinium conductrix]|uniref:Endoglucanase n=1 Tax=Micractinium conductrix TaxID=554055 RepID=A0A2P6V0X8_9CHLO|nr:endo-beta-1,4-glucanase 1 [Micractinium conductrix]|eukprot:PSC67746.1 endo-beta-1,4-glucanase 1 [Micractinium conductrix]